MAAAEQAEDQDQDAISEKKVINRTFLSLSQITALSEQTIEGVQTKMEEFLNFERITVSFKEAILLDYYTSGFLWAKEMNFSLIQLSGFMDLLNFLLENLSDKHMTLGDNLKELGKAMAGIRETDSEGDLNFFSIEEAKAVIDYLNISLFKHYKQYEYLFQNHTEELLISNEGSDQEPESFETDSVDGVIDEDLKSAVAEILNEIICNLEAELDEELQMQEEA
ncbi:ciliary-associated calcium-binding coiled-coil protein 1 [Apus apus]|uniref:ciliary-associated calcium-binding coiled-coil protein 1 n=1 Tax=Apus apus TaxID=8895 RepID=UPI0021F8F44B|nr:ciliary-associated calcium-binding coiled-coil protein 1 [Apus apus]